MLFIYSICMSSIQEVEGLRTMSSEQYGTGPVGLSGAALMSAAITERMNGVLRAIASALTSRLRIKQRNATQQNTAKHNTRQHVSGSSAVQGVPLLVDVHEQRVEACHRHVDSEVEFEAVHQQLRDRREVMCSRVSECESRRAHEQNVQVDTRERAHAIRRSLLNRKLNIM